MMPSRRLLGLQVIDITNGRAVGRVSRLLFDPAARRLAGFVVASGRWSREDQILEYARARGIGIHAITIQGAEALARPSAVPELQPLLRHPARIYGSRVLTEDGEWLGTVDELIVDERSGQVVEVLLAPRNLAERLRGPLRLSSDPLVVVGEDAMVVRAGTRPSAHRTGQDGSTAPGARGRHAPDGPREHPERTASSAVAAGLLSAWKGSIAAVRQLATGPLRQRAPRE